MGASLNNRLHSERKSMDSRLECRFEHGDCVIHSPTTGPSTHRGPPVLCSHAAAALDQQVVQAQAERDNVLRNYRHVQGERDVAESRLAQAEAREAAMREALEVLMAASRGLADEEK